MAGGRTGGRWHGVAWGQRARTLAFVVGGAIVAAAGIAYVRRQHLRRNHPKSLEEKGTGDTAEEERGSQRNTHGHDVEETALVKPTAGGGKLNAPAAKESTESSSRLVHDRLKVQPITVGLSCVGLPLGAAPRESFLRQKKLDGRVIPPGAAAAAVNDHGLYLTSSGLNRALLKRTKGEDAMGGFGEVTFWRTASGQEFALKKAKDTAGGRRQLRREIEFLIDFKRLHPDAANIVGVVEARTAPFDMLLLRKEPMTLSSMLENALSIDVVAVAKVLFGVLAAIDLLHENGFVHRDVKGDNMLVGEDGSGILADFGLCIATADASLPELLGDGTADYAAPEVTRKLSGSTVCTELYSWFVVFVEAVMMRHPFGGEELFDARVDRLEYLKDKRENMTGMIEDVRDELESLLGRGEDNAGGGGAAEGKEEEEMSVLEQRLQLQEELEQLMADLDAVRLQEWRLCVRSPEWQPSGADKAVLDSLGEPLGFFIREVTTRRNKQQQEEVASGEAKADPSRLFDGDDWVRWLPGPSSADCKQGIRLAIDFVVEKGALHPDPDSRPQDVDAARGLLTEAVALYERQRRREIELDEDDEASGATRRESGAGG